MAEEIQIAGTDQQVKVRNPWAPALLPIITLGIYHLVWYYKILAEMKAYGDRVGDEQLQTIVPVRGLLAVFPGAFLLGIPTLISYIQTARHVKRMQELTYYDHVDTFTRPGLAFLTVTLQDYTPPDKVPASWVRRSASTVSSPATGASFCNSSTA